MVHVFSVVHFRLLSPSKGIVDIFSCCCYIYTGLDCCIEVCGFYYGIFSPWTGIEPSGLIGHSDFTRRSDDSYNTFFSETGHGKHVPRALYIDLEPSVIGKLLQLVFLDHSFAKFCLLGLLINFWTKPVNVIYMYCKYDLS